MFTIIYCLSYTISGSLGMSVFDMNGYLVGASGGVYALLAAHLANILLVSAYILNKLIVGSTF